MNKINFVNGAAPALNATNLNQMQDNIDNAKIEKSTIYSGDLNDINDTCFYYTDNCANRPITNNNGYVFTHKLADNYLYQKFIVYNSLQTYERVKVNGTWESWNLISTPLEFLDLSTILSNEWSTNGMAEAFKKDGIVHLAVSIRNGTSTTIGQLPAGFRPVTDMIINASNASGGVAGYAYLTSSGWISVSANIFKSGVSNLIFNCTFRAS